MNKIASLVLAGTLLAGTCFAQVDKKAQDILKSVSAKYKSYSSIKADFSYTLENAQAKSKETQGGTILLKGNKYKLLIAGQEVISDGKTIWTYSKDNNEVQVNSVDPSADEIKPSEIFTMYEKGFLYKFNAEKTVAGKVQQIIELTPVDKKKDFFKVMLTIDKAAKQIISATIFDKSGSKYTYAIKNFTANPPVTDATFGFDAKKYPGIEVVDLR